MKKIVVMLLALCLILAGCAAPQTDGEEKNVLTDIVINAAAETNDTVAETTADTAPETTETEATEPALVISPLPDSTMENLTDAVLSVSLAEGDAYVDDNGIMQMDLKIYTYDKYDMVDIAAMKVGDTIVRHSGEVVITSLEQLESGAVRINGGLDGEGFELVTDDSGIFYEMGYNDAKNWYEIGEATIRVSADFQGLDCADLELGEVVLYPGDFLVGAVTNYDFTPYNTTIRVEAGQIMEMNRAYMP